MGLAEEDLDVGELELVEEEEEEEALLLLGSDDGTPWGLANLKINKIKKGHPKIKVSLPGKLSDMTNWVFLSSRNSRPKLFIHLNDGASYHMLFTFQWKMKFWKTVPQKICIAKLFPMWSC